jgi:hypothetical protein
MVDLVVLQSASYVAAALGVCVAAFYYVMTLRAQQNNMKATLKTRESQLFMTLYNKISGEEYMKHHMNIMSTDWKDYEDFKAKVLSDPEKHLSLHMIALTMEGVGVLVKENLVDIKLVAMYIAGSTRQCWEKLRPVIQHYRREEDYSRYMSEFEYVYNRLMDYMAVHPELLT